MTSPVYDRSTWFTSLARKRGDVSFQGRRLSESLNLQSVTDPSYRPTSPYSSRARIASAVGRKTISRRFFGRFRSYSLHGQQRSATCLVEAMVKGGRRWLGRGREGRGCRERKGDRERERGPLRSARLKFLHTNEWQPKNQTKEERARGKNQEGREGGKNLSHAAAFCAGHRRMSRDR